MNKRILFLLVTMLALPASFCRLHAQESSIAPTEEEEAFPIVEKMPEFPGGEKALFQFLSENIEYPDALAHTHAQGRVVCRFIVEKDGSISHVEVFHSSGYEALDNEAVRVISSMPNWTPGEQEGKKVRVKYYVPINFKLQAPEPEPEPVMPEIEEVLAEVDKMPKFPGGEKGLQKFIKENMQYPALAKERGLEGKTTCAVIINKEGKVTSVQVIEGSGFTLLDREAVRLLNTLPQWEPGSNKGEVVSVIRKIAVDFSLGKKKK